MIQYLCLNIASFISETCNYVLTTFRVIIFNIWYLDYIWYLAGKSTTLFYKRHPMTDLCSTYLSNYLKQVSEFCLRQPPLNRGTVCCWPQAVLSRNFTIIKKTEYKNKMITLTMMQDLGNNVDKNHILLGSSTDNQTITQNGCT